MLCIPHFSYNQRKLTGQNKVKVGKLQSQNFSFKSNIWLPYS